MSGNIEAAQKIWRQVALLSPSDRISNIPFRAALRRDQDRAKLDEATASPECQNENDAWGRMIFNQPF